MIKQGSKLNVADNTGAKLIECITVLGHKSGRTAKIGDIISASVKVAIPRGVVSKKDIVRCVVVRTKNGLKREDGSSIKFDDNAAVIIDNEYNPRGSRIFGPIPRELRKKFMRVISLAPDVL